MMRLQNKDRKLLMVAVGIIIVFLIIRLFVFWYSNRGLNQIELLEMKVPTVASIVFFAAIYILLDNHVISWVQNILKTHSLCTLLLIYGVAIFVFILGEFIAGATIGYIIEERSGVITAAVIAFLLRMYLKKLPAQ